MKATKSVINCARVTKATLPDRWLLNHAPLHCEDCNRHDEDAICALIVIGGITFSFYSIAALRNFLHRFDGRRFKKVKCTVVLLDGPVIEGASRDVISTLRSMFCNIDN